jgi:hypothetical protein
MNKGQKKGATTVAIKNVQRTEKKSKTIVENEQSTQKKSTNSC